MSDELPPALTAKNRDVRSVRRRELIEDLRVERRWFYKRAKRMRLIWRCLSITSLMLSLLTSVLVGIGWPEQGDKAQKITMLVIPALISFCGSMMIMFRPQESWALRLRGAIDVEDLIVDARMLSVDASDFDDVLKNLRAKLRDIVRRQADGYVALLSEKRETKLDSPNGEGD